MAQTIKLKRTATPSNVPTTAQLELGEIAVNTYDGNVYIKKNDGADAIVKINANPSDLNYFVNGEGTVAGTWLGTDPDITSYYDGLVIWYRITVAGASTTTLNVNGLGAKTIYRYSTAKLTTHWPVGSVIPLVYVAALNGGSFIGGYDWSDGTQSYDLRWSSAVVNGTSIIHGYQLLMEGADTKFYPVTVGGVANSTTNTVQTAPLRIGGQMLYYNSATDIAVNAVIGGNLLYESIESGEGEYWMNRTNSSSWTAIGLPLYIVGTVNANNELILDNSTTTAFLTNALPTTEDGKVYIHVGYSDNEDDLWRLSVTHPIFEFKAGAIRRYTPALIPSEVLDAVKTVDGSGSGLDADLLDGMNATDSRDGNTIVMRQANGYMQAVYVNTTDDASSTSLGWLYGQRSNSDGYHRRFNAASIRDWGGFFTTANDGSGSGLDADLLDGQQGSYYAQASLSNNKTYSSGGNAAGSYLGGHYSAGGTEKPNSSTFGSGKLKLAMLSPANLGFGGGWNDVLWMSGYNGGDVKKSTAIVSSKYDDTSLWVAKQNFDSATWGTGYLLWNAGNDGSGSGLDADLLDGQHGSYYAPASHNHTGVYLPIGGKAADSELLDGIDSTSFLRSDANDAFTGNLTTGADNHITFGPNSSWGSSLRIGGNGRTATGTEMASIVTTDGNLHLDAANSANGIYLNFYAGTNGTYFGNGASGIVAKMFADGQLYKSGTNVNPYWNSTNDGSGSGLDADLLDGQQGSYYYPASNPNGYTNDQTAAEILTAIKTVDGSGSGLDADSLDGYDRQQLMPYQSSSDFVDGTLVTTNISASPTNGDSFVIEVTGKAYGGSVPHSIIAEGYLYADTVINTNGTNISGSNFTYLKVMNNGGSLCFWWPRHSYWNSYDVYVRSSSAGTGNSNRVTSIVNSVDPAGATKKIQINLATSWTSLNDGSGSGLDADLLDGQQGSYYATAASVAAVAALDPVITLTGAVTGTGTMTNLGNVSITTTNTADPVLTLTGDVTGSATFTNLGNATLTAVVADDSHNHIISNVDGLQTALDSKLNLSGGTLTGQLLRSAHNTGFFVGGHNSIGNTAAQSSPIYTIGTSYVPDATTLGNMYGIGFTESSSASFISGNLVTGGTGWGMYVAADGDARIFFNASGGTITSTGQHYAGGSVVWNAGNDGSGSGLDADLLDGQQGSYYYAASNPSGYQTTSGSVAQSNYVSGSAFATTASPGSVLEYQQASGQTDTRLSPTTDWYNSIRMGHGNPYDYYSNTIAMRMTGGGSGTMFTQLIHNNVPQGWRTQWDSGNDGSGSGLDADLLDGQHASAFAPASHSHSYLPLSGGTVTGATSLRAGGTHLGNHEFASASGTSTGYSDAGIEIREGAYGGSGAYSAPRLAFHWGGVVASNISMDSAGAILIRNNPGTGYENFRANNIYANGTNLVWHAGNDGSGSGLDADRLDGYEASTGTSPYTAAIRDGSGNLPGNISTATTLQTARTINGVSFNGSANITVEPYIEDDEGTDATRLIVFTDNSTAGFKRLNEDSGLSYNPLNNLLKTTGVNANVFYVGTNTTSASINAPSVNGNLGLNAGSTAYNVYIAGGATNYAQFSNTLITHYSRLYSAPGTSETASTPNFESRAQGSGNGVPQYHMSFTNSTGAVNGRITTNNFGTTYATTSDYRVKEDLQEMEDATSRLLQLKPINFKWVGSENRTDGFLAHEVKEIVHDAVVGEKDATETVVEIVVDEEGNETEVTKVVASLQALDQAKLVPLLVKTIQELEARIKLLESK